MAIRSKGFSQGKISSNVIFSFLKACSGKEGNEPLNNMTYSSPCNLAPLFFEFWLVDTWFFAHPRDQGAVTRLKNVRQLNIRQGKKLGFKLSHTQPY